MPEDNIENEFEENNVNNKEADSESVDGMEFSLFLILILLIMGNNTTFNSYFQLLNDQVNSVQEIMNAFSATANGLQGAFEKPQQFKNLDI